MAKEYEWAPGSRVDVDPNDAGRELERVAELHGGELRPRDLVIASRPDDAVLHDAFEWDDAIAAEAHRTSQASLVVRSLLVYETEEEAAPEFASYRAWRSVPDENDKRARHYEPAGRVLQDDEKLAFVLNEMQQRLTHWAQELRQFKSMAQVQRSTQRLLRDLEKAKVAAD